VCSKAVATAFDNEKNKGCGWRGVYVLARLLVLLLYYLYCWAAVCGVDNTPFACVEYAACRWPLSPCGGGQIGFPCLMCKALLVCSYPVLAYIFWIQPSVNSCGLPLMVSK
jgi:hypothetical protein